MATVKYPVSRQTNTNQSALAQLVNYGQAKFQEYTEGTIEFKYAKAEDNLANKDIAKINSVKLYFEAWETSGPSVSKVGFKPLGTGSSAGEYTTVFNSGAFSYDTSGKGYTANYNVSAFKKSHLYGDFKIERTVGQVLVQNMYITIDYTINTYTISVASNGNGTVSGGGTGLLKGQTVNISAVPNEGYVFAYWSDGNRNPSRTISASSNITYTATFVPKLYVERSTYIQNGTNGYYVYTQVKDTGNGIGRVQFPTWTNPEQDDIQPDWGNNPIASGTSGTWEINGLSYNYCYQVNVSDHNYEYLGYNTHIYPYDLTGNQGLTGGVALNMQFTTTVQASPERGGTVTPSTTVNYGTIITISATPNAGYTFDGWSDGVMDTTRTITVLEDLTYTAIFSPIPITSLDISNTSLDIKLSSKVNLIHDYIQTLYNNNVDCEVYNGTFEIQPNYLMLNSTGDDCHIKSYQMSNSMNDIIKKYIFSVEPNTEYSYMVNAKLSNGNNYSLFAFYYDSDYNYISFNCQESITKDNASFKWTTPSNATYCSLRVDNNIANNIIYFTNVFVYRGNIDEIYNTAYLAQIIEPLEALNRLALWTSSNPEVVAINESTGKLIAYRNGTAIITCQARDTINGIKTIQCIVNVSRNKEDYPISYLGSTPVKIYLGKDLIHGYHFFTQN